MSAGRDTFMRRAIELSRRQLVHAEGGGPFGAVVVRDGAIIGEGWNQVVSGNDPTAHAEVMAIRAACRHLGDFSLAGAEIYTSCEPCPMCLAAILWARIGRIFYANTRDDAAAIGFDDEYFYREVSRPIAERAVPAEKLLAGEARAVFDEWAKIPDRTKY
jgi:guanine deaminase